MKRLLTPRTALALLVMSMGANSFALSVGALQGATIVGRPLDVSAPVQFDARDANDACLRADVFYGDARVPSSSVQVHLQRRANGDAGVRVVSSKAVDEPVVTVVVNAGCQGTTVSRRFELLADAPVAAAQPIEPAAALPRAMGAGPLIPVSAQRIPGAARAAPTRSSGSRLRMDASDTPEVWNRVQPWLRVSMEMGAGPAVDTTQRAAAALLWQAIAAQPADLVRMGDRMRSLEGELAALGELSGRNRTEISRMNGQADPGVGGASWWSIVALLLAAAGASAAFLGRRHAKARRAAVPPDDWFTDLRTPPRHEAEAEPVAPPIAVVRKGAFAAAQAFFSSKPASLEANRPLVVDEILPDEPPAAAAERPAHFLDADLSLPHLNDGAGESGETAARDGRKPRRHLQVVALGEALQEAEFLVSLGEGERAVDVLRDHVSGAKEHSPLAWLELIQLCRDVGDAEGVDESENEFRRLYGEDAPRAGAVSGIEACGPALARISAAWHSREVFAVLEELLFGDPAALGGYASLNAWRDLMWLYDLAQDTMRGPGRRTAPPVSASESPEMTLDMIQGHDFAPAAHSFAVDCDVTDVPTDRHRVFDLQHVPRLPPMVQPPPSMAIAKPPTVYEDFFDAAVAAEGRSLFMAR
ncbi:hypothetical protein [Ramlibacter sp.]|uniref:FimV/HubP-related protein n=1 Tax=Ramlibacter sp. TaxID=1917967 RepID=UPI003D13CAA7